MPRTPTELASHFEEQLHFLRASAASYDAGQLSEAKRLATTVSTLVNSNPRGTSVALLSQMGVRDDMPFLSYAEPLEFRFPKLGLVNVEANSISGARFVPICGSPFGRYSPSHWTDFKTWWAGQPIYEYRSPAGDIRHLTRLDLTRYLRSQDGGSHIDQDLSDEAYIALSQLAETGVYAYANGQMAGLVVQEEADTKPILDGHLAAMRQIAFELEQSLIQAGLTRQA